jgi:hypothetical protein
VPFPANDENGHSKVARDEIAGMDDNKTSAESASPSEARTYQMLEIRLTAPQMLALAQAGFSGEAAGEPEGQPGIA